MFFVNQKTAYEMRISDWSSDVCSSDLSGQQLFAILFQLFSKPAENTGAACAFPPPCAPSSLRGHIEELRIRSPKRPESRRESGRGCDSPQSLLSGFMLGSVDEQPFFPTCSAHRRDRSGLRLRASSRRGARFVAGAKLGRA